MTTSDLTTSGGLEDQLSDDLKAALARMEQMTPEELEAFRAADMGDEFGASHLSTIQELLRRERVAAGTEEEGEAADPDLPTPADLLVNVLTAERGPEVPEALKNLPPGVETGPIEPPPPILMPTKLIVTVVVGRFEKGRMTGEWPSDPLPVLADPDEEHLFQSGIEALTGAVLENLQKQLNTQITEKKAG